MGMLAQSKVRPLRFGSRRTRAFWHELVTPLSVTTSATQNLEAQADVVVSGIGPILIEAAKHAQAIKQWSEAPKLGRSRESVRQVLKLLKKLRHKITSAPKGVQDAFMPFLERFERGATFVQADLAAKDDRPSRTYRYVAAEDLAEFMVLRGEQPTQTPGGKFDALMRIMLEIIDGSKPHQCLQDLLKHGVFHVKAKYGSATQSGRTASPSIPVCGVTPTYGTVGSVGAGASMPVV